MPQSSIGEQHDYSGGINAVTSPFLIGPKQVARASNMLYDEHGSLRTVDGTKIISNAPGTELGSRILLPITWLPVAGVLQALVITQPSIGVNKLWSWAVAPWVQIGLFEGNTNIPSFSILNNLMVFTDGYFGPKSWDGATFQRLAGYPANMGAQHIIHHQGFLYALNTNPNTYQFDGPSALRQSDLNQPTSWNNNQMTFVAKDDGTQGRGLAVYTIAEAGIPPTDTMVIFKDKSTFQMIGNLGTGGGSASTNFQLQQVKSDMGCYSAKSIQYCSGFGIIRLTHRGFALFDGVDDRLISEEIRPYLFGRDDIGAIDWTLSNYSWSGQSHNPPLYICFCPTTDGKRMSRAFAYDLIRRAWSVIDLPFRVASISLVDLTAGPAPSPILDFPYGPTAPPSSPPPDPFIGEAGGGGSGGNAGDQGGVGGGSGQGGSDAGDGSGDSGNA